MLPRHRHSSHLPKRPPPPRGAARPHQRSWRGCPAPVVRHHGPALRPRPRLPPEPRPQCRRIEPHRQRRDRAAGEDAEMEAYATAAGGSSRDANDAARKRPSTVP
jgi:hypothetical protein